MQTQAEQELIATVSGAIDNAAQNSAEDVTLLNIGAGASPLIERALDARLRQTAFVVDRLDIETYPANAPRVRRCYTGSVEAMTMIDDASYDIVFANYVFEHVGNIDAALKETRRVLKRGGRLIISVPNPRAPEFIVSKHTPHSFHTAVRGREEIAFETEYAYRSISDLIQKAKAAGLTCERVERSSSVYAYGQRFPILGPLSRVYDSIVNALGIRFLMGQACLVCTAS